MPAELVERAYLYHWEAPPLALDAGGVAFGLWTVKSPSPYGWLRGARRLGTGWDPPQALNAGDLYDGSLPQVGALGPDGALAVWQTRDSILWNRFEARSGWGPPERLGAASPYPGSQRLWSDEAGHAFVLWQRRDDWVARYFESPAGWGPDLPMPAPPSTSLRGPQLAARPDGAIEILWMNVDSVSTFYFYTSVWANRFVPRSGWSDLVALDREPRLGCTQALVSDVVGSIAVWGCRTDPLDLNKHGTWYSRRNGSGPWSASRPIGSLPEAASFARLAGDTIGNALALWTVGAESTRELWAGSLRRGGDWGGVTVIARPERPDAQVGVAALDYRPSGEGLAALVDGRRTSWQLRSVQYAGLTWRQPQAITGVRDHMIFGSVRLVPMPSGETHLVWSEYPAQEVGATGVSYSPGTIWSSRYVAE